VVKFGVRIFAGKQCNPPCMDVLRVHLQLYAVGSSQHPLRVQQCPSARMEHGDGRVADEEANLPGPGPWSHIHAPHHLSVQGGHPTF